ncbi:eukaryotic translation initiation factor 4E [Tulasnella sp. 427]|nr:eukaryotic translation initiation factor 4E [Tulasnella sp. 427]
MSPVSSSLPQSAHTAAQQALQAALNDPSSKPPTSDDDKMDSTDIENTPKEEELEGQEIEAPAGLGSLPLNETARTVFDDPMTFNVKHPLYTPWTLWFDSPQTKGKAAGTPATPVSATIPATPLTAQAQSWMDDIKKVINFDSVEEFWGLYNNIVPPSQLPQKANYYLFKENIIPAWEDDANKYGGKWSIQLPRDKNRNHIDKMWLYTMLAAIGETFDPVFSQAAANAGSEDDASPKTAPPQSLITGVIVSTRPQFYRLSIWTRLAPGIAGPQTPARALTSSGFSPASNLPPHPSEDGDALRDRIEAIGKHFKTSVLGYGESQKLGGPLATEVEFVSHKESEKKGRTKKWVV